MDRLEPEGDSLELLLIKQLLGQVDCANCGALYHPDDARLVEGHRGIWILVVHCRSCEVRGIVLVTVGDLDDFEEDEEEFDDELEAWLEPDEVETAVPAEWPALTANDVLDWHAFLQGFPGDLRDLLRNRSC
jgi:hypothetical protein